MATYQADVAAPETGSPKVRAAKKQGTVRQIESTFTVPTGGLAIADVIQWGRVPLGSMVKSETVSLSFAAGTASSTINLGVAAAPTRFLAATSVASAGTATGSLIAAGAATPVAADDTTAATNDTMIQSVVAGAALAAGQVITMRALYVCP